ncbi:hypothetical protein ACFTS5_11080 [Nocardia sp. NPDC056952]|uniref:hypothetical protein n=1 Tax=Nocardia sp. NPDC056952 TaxID=3345979 RepID=UPI00363202C6
MTDISAIDTRSEHTALRASPEYLTRTEVAREVGRAAQSVGSVGIPLGQWTARGDWATLSEEARALAGTRALELLDTALAELTTARARLADTVATDQAGDPG